VGRSATVGFLDFVPMTAATHTPASRLRGQCVPMGIAAT